MLDVGLLCLVVDLTFHGFIAGCFELRWLLRISGLYAWFISAGCVYCLLSIAVFAFVFVWCKLFGCEVCLWVVLVAVFCLCCVVLVVFGFVCLCLYSLLLGYFCVSLLLVLLVGLCVMHYMLVDCGLICLLFVICYLCLCGLF